MISSFHRFDRCGGGGRLVFSFFDCHHLYHRIAAGEAVPDEGFLTTFGVALLLIGTGAFALIGNLFSFLNRFLMGGVLHTLSNLFFPLLLIALGLLILYQTKKRSEGQEPLHFDRFFKKSDGSGSDSEPHDSRATVINGLPYGADGGSGFTLWIRHVCYFYRKALRFFSGGPSPFFVKKS